MAVTAVSVVVSSEQVPGSIGSNGSAPAAEFQRTEAVVPMTAGEERALRAWLAHIEETDEAIIAHALNQCRADSAVRGYFLRRARRTAAT